MDNFLNDDYLLSNPLAKVLYHNYAEKMPIIDYHCHIQPQEIAQDKKYENITQIWLYGDHYKWRLMRANGVDEKYVTGDASDYEKFEKWAETMPACVGNPLYLWSHLELKRYFGVDKLLSGETAKEIWDKTSAVIQSGKFSTRSIIEQSNVRVICTTDNPVDDLRWHKQISEDKSFKTKVYPAFRPDVLLRIGNPDFPQWVEKLGKAAGMGISSLADFEKAVVSRIEYFHKMGCRVSDHALDPLAYRKATPAQADEVFRAALAGKAPDAAGEVLFKSWLLLLLGREYKKRDWVMQYHISTIRNVNSAMFEKLGPDTGYDAVGVSNYSSDLAALLDALNRADSLPKTILYSLNPNDYETLFTIGLCFSGQVPGKVQLGAAWWFNDHRFGIEKQLNTYANLGLLSKFVGMLTDSRSFLSYTRHEYFRRVLCNLIGEWARNGDVPNDEKMLGKMVQDICYNNADRFFGFGK